MVLGNGDILKCSTATNPSRIIAKWKCEDPKGTVLFAGIDAVVCHVLADADTVCSLLCFGLEGAFQPKIASMSFL